MEGRRPKERGGGQIFTNKKSPIAPAIGRIGAYLQSSASNFGETGCQLFPSVTHLFCRNHDLAAIVQRAIEFEGVVEEVTLARCGASGDLRGIRCVVCAAGAFATLRVPPFWIWHDRIFCGRRLRAEG